MESSTRRKRLLYNRKAAEQRLGMDYAFWEQKAKRRQFNERLLPFIGDIMDMTQRVYPDMWELQPYIKTINEAGQGFHVILEARMVIRFPELTITNSRSHSLTVKDMYVSFLLQPQSTSISIPNLSGVRTTFTPAEYTTGYIHSHLSGRGDMRNINKALDWSNFCLGSGGINNTMNDLGMNWGIEQYRLFLLQLQTFLEYESLEGGPYQTMDQVFPRQTEVQPVLNFHNIVSKCESIIPHMNASQLNLTLKKNKLRFTDTNQTNNFLIRCGGSNDIIYLDSSGKAYPVDIAMTIDDVSCTSGIYFGGQEVPIKIENSIVLKEPKRSIHPFIRSMYAKYIEGKLIKQLVDEKYNLKEETPAEEATFS